MVLKFINRKTELGFLEERHKNKGFECIVIYGRRRVGKTELLKHFLNSKEHIYFLCDKSGTNRNIARFKKKIADHFAEPAIESEDLEEIFDYLVKKLKKRIVIVFDEFSYLVEKDSAMPSVFQRVIDEILKYGNVMLIICGSSISMMEKGVLSSKSPLYGRKTGHWKLSPLLFADSCRFFPGNSFAKNIEFWSVLDGIPFYLEKFSEKESTLRNIERQIVSKKGRLYEEIDFLLKEELREPDAYKSLLEAIGAGRTKVVEIANYSRINVQDLDKYLKVLMRLGIIKKERPITEKPKTKRTIYSYDDNFFHFWFRFCEPFKSDIEIGELQGLTGKIQRDLNAFVGQKFEDICRYTLGHFLNFTRVGRWWGHYRDKDRKRREIEIDIVALNEQNKEILFAECKWKDNVDAAKTIRELREKTQYVEWHNRTRKEYFVIFAKSFKKKVVEKDLELFDLEDMLKRMRSHGGQKKV